MACHRTRSVTALFIGLLGGGIIVISNVGCPATQTDLLYKQVVPVRDPERRLQQLGNVTDDKLVDTTAFAGMPERYAEVVSTYTESVLSAINATPITRQRYYHKDRDGEAARFPDYVNPIRDRDVVVPLVVFPRPDAVRTWAASKKAQSLGWRADGKAVEKRGSVYGRSLIYEAGIRSSPPLSVPAVQFETDIPSGGLYIPEHNDSFFFKLGKMVLTPSYDDSPHRALMDESADLRLGEKEGARLLGELITVPAYLPNNRLRWVSIRNGSNVRQCLAYSLLDGNGPKRPGRFAESKNGPISPYVRPLICARHQPQIKQHDELLLPTPLGWPPTSGDMERFQSAHEEWCLDDWFPAQKDACWVIREAEDSKPLQESFLLMPVSEKSERPVFFIALFAETEPKQLINELAALYKVSPDAALNSPETMQRLNSLYEKVRDFPLAK